MRRDEAAAPDPEGSCATASSTRLSFEFVVRRCFFIKSALEALEMPGRPFLHDVNHPHGPKGAHAGETCSQRSSARQALFKRRRRREWWSQTGSNRRPHACKARALPTELWPQSGKQGRREAPRARRARKAKSRPRRCAASLSGRMSAPALEANKKLA